MVVVTSTHQELPSTHNFRFGHALADSPVAKLTLPQSPGISQPAVRRPCGKRIKDKAIEISNTFRHALGLPTIETAQPKPGEHVHGGMVHILPFVGTPPMFVKPTELNVKGEHGVVSKPGRHPHHFHHHAHTFHEWGNTFWVRLHNALTALGPLEGRAVAFVLGE